MLTYQRARTAVLYSSFEHQADQQKPEPVKVVAACPQLPGRKRTGNV